jgi:hypothetical protein
MKRLVTAALLAGGAVAAFAQGKIVEVVCPIDGEVYLDQKPVDPAFPWPHAKCPTSGFVIYRSDFSRGRIVRLKEFVRTDEYQRLSKIHTTHYLEAVMRRHLGDPPYVVAYALLQASWEVAGDPERYRQYAGEALAAYDAIPLDSLPEIRHRILKRMISAELARRLGQFDSARDRLLEMRDAAELSKPFYQRIVELQLKLVRARDSAPHKIAY